MRSHQGKKKISAGGGGGKKKKSAAFQAGPKSCREEREPGSEEMGGLAIRKKKDEPTPGLRNQ